MVMTTASIIIIKALKHKNRFYFTIILKYIFPLQNILGGSLQNLIPATDRLVKAKSDGSLASTTTTATATDASFSKMKSRSLEPLTGLAMWSSEPQIIELMKGERGLGFSILDYQVNSKNNDSPYFYPKDSIFSSGSSCRKSESLSENPSQRSRNVSSSSKDSVFFSPIPKSSLQNPLRKNQKDQHVRFNFGDQGRRYLSCAVHDFHGDGGPRSPSSPWSGSELSGTSSPSYTSNGEGGSRSPVVPFNYHIYI